MAFTSVGRPGLGALTPGNCTAYPSCKCCTSLLERSQRSDVDTTYPATLARVQELMTRQDTPKAEDTPAVHTLFLAGKATRTFITLAGQDTHTHSARTLTGSQVKDLSLLFSSVKHLALGECEDGKGDTVQLFLPTRYSACVADEREPSGIHLSLGKALLDMYPNSTQSLKLMVFGFCEGLFSVLSRKLRLRHDSAHIFPGSTRRYRYKYLPLEECKRLTLNGVTMLECFKAIRTRSHEKYTSKPKK